jgi:hypothetical protein
MLKLLTLNTKPEKMLAQYQDQKITITYEGLAERFIRLNTQTEKERSKKS